MKQIKLDPKERTAQLLAAALRQAQSQGFNRITREAIAKDAGVSDRLVSYHLGTMDNIKRAVMRHAIKEQCLPVIAQGLIARDRHARKCPPELQQKALAAAMS